MTRMVINLVTDDLVSKIIPPNTIKTFNGLDELHKTLSPELLSKQISALKPGETIAMLVRRQNCALMIHMPLKKDRSLSKQSDRVIVATFPGNLHPKKMCEQGGDIAVSSHILKKCFRTNHLVIFFSVRLSNTSIECSVFKNDMFRRFCRTAMLSIF